MDVKIGEVNFDLAWVFLQLVLIQRSSFVSFVCVKFTLFIGTESILNGFYLAVLSNSQRLINKMHTTTSLIEVIFSPGKITIISTNQTHGIWGLFLFRRGSFCCERLFNRSKIHLHCSIQDQG
jgi:hypothetical protein